MRTIEVTLYNFDELSEEGQRQALINLSDINVDHDWWDGDCWLELSTDQIKARRIKTVYNSRIGQDISDVQLTKGAEWTPDNNKNIDGYYPHYTGLFSWDDMYFDLGRGHYLQFNELRVNDDETFRKFLRIPKQLWENVHYAFWVHNQDTKLHIEENDPNRPFTERQLEIIDRATEIFNGHVQDAWNDLHETYLHLLSDEAIKEAIEANEYEFTEDGKLA